MNWTLVVSLYMCLQHVFPRKWFVTEWTVKSQFFCLMFAYHVSVQGVFIREAFPTDSAWMFVDSSVGVLMNLHDDLTGKCFSTDRARETHTRWSYLEQINNIKWITDKQNHLNKRSLHISTKYKHTNLNGYDFLPSDFFHKKFSRLEIFSVIAYYYSLTNLQLLYFIP